MTREFGWSRTEFSLGLTVLALVTTPLAPFVGALSDRLGARWVGVPGAALHALAFAAFGLVTPSLWHWLAAWAVYALFQMTIRSMIWTGPISAAFSASRGMALAIFMSGTALAQFFGPLITRWMIDDHGWRTSFIASGLIWGGLGFVLVALFFKDMRHGKARPAQGQAASAAISAGGLTLAQAVRDWRLIRIGLAMTIQSLIVTGFMLHLVPMLSGSGMPRSAATTIIALAGISSLCGQLLAGFLLDRVRGSVVAALCFASPALGFLALLQLIGGSQLGITAIVLFIGLGTGTTMNIIIYLTTRFAGVSNFGAIFGLISSFMGLASGLGPPLAGWIFDTTGNYSAFLVIAAVGAVTAGLLLLRLGPYPVFEPVQPTDSTAVSSAKPAA